MSIAGIPPFNGFFSKLIIILACIQAHHVGYAFIAVIGIILTLASFMKVQKYAFFGALNKKWQAAKEVPFGMRLSMIVLACVCIAAGALLLPKFSPFLTGAADVLFNGKNYAILVLGAAK